VKKYSFSKQKGGLKLFLVRQNYKPISQ